MSESLRADPAATIISTSLILPLNVKLPGSTGIPKELILPPRSLITVGTISFTSVTDVDRNNKIQLILFSNNSTTLFFMLSELCGKTLSSIIVEL